MLVLHSLVILFHFGPRSCLSLSSSLASTTLLQSFFAINSIFLFFLFTLKSTVLYDIWIYYVFCLDVFFCVGTSQCAESKLPFLFGPLHKLTLPFQSIGRIYNLSDEIIGITGEILLLIQLPMRAFSQMAFSACFGAPTFSKSLLFKFLSFLN